MKFEQVVALGVLVLIVTVCAVGVFVTVTP